MRITQVKVKLASALEGDRLRAFCSLTFDGCFVVHEVRVIDGPRGLFVAMPSRPASFRCSKCRAKIALRSRYCSDCGRRVSAAASAAARRDHDYLDTAHPINADFRREIESVVIEAYTVAQQEAEAQAQGGVDTQVSGRSKDAENEGGGAAALESA